MKSMLNLISFWSPKTKMTVLKMGLKHKAYERLAQRQNLLQESILSFASLSCTLKLSYFGRKMCKTNIAPLTKKIPKGYETQKFYHKGTQNKINEILVFKALHFLNQSLLFADEKEIIIDVLGSKNVCYLYLEYKSLYDRFFLDKSCPSI